MLPKHDPYGRRGARHRLPMRRQACQRAYATIATSCGIVPYGQSQGKTSYKLKVTYVQRGKG